MNVSPSSPHAEYLEANKDTLTIIGSVIERAIIEPSLEVIHFPLKKETTISIGAWNPEDIEEDEGLPEEYCARISHIKNAVVEATALIDILTVQTFATVEYAAARDLHEEVPRLRQFGNAVIRSSYFMFPDINTSLELTKVALHEVEDVGSAGSYEITIIDPDLEESVNMFLYNNMVSSIHWNVSTTEDEVRQRLMNYFCNDGSQTVKDVVNILTGFIEEEDEMDEKLWEIWLRYQGSSREDEVSTVLDELRTKAIGIAENIRLRKEHYDLSLPSSEKLAEIADLVCDI